jgi:hypothetical protein
LEHPTPQGTFIHSRRRDERRVRTVWCGGVRGKEFEGNGKFGEEEDEEDMRPTLKKSSKEERKLNEGVVSMNADE